VRDLRVFTPRSLGWVPVVAGAVAYLSLRRFSNAFAGGTIVVVVDWRKRRAAVVLVVAELRKFRRLFSMLGWF